MDWSNPADQHHGVDNHIGEEVNRRLKMYHEQAVQDRRIMHNNWSTLPDPTTPVLTPTGEVETSDTESDREIV